MPALAQIEENLGIKKGNILRALKKSVRFFIEDEPDLQGIKAEDFRIVGSYAKGKATRLSDVDLVLILNKRMPRDWEDSIVMSVSDDLEREFGCLPTPQFRKLGQAVRPKVEVHDVSFRRRPKVPKF